MSPQYSSQQPSGFQNHVQRVAMIGIGGNIGKFTAESLIATRHNVTAIPRPDSQAVFPTRLYDTKDIDYNDHSSIVNVLKDQEALVISLSVFTPGDT